MFEFADIDRDGLLDMVFLTDTGGMNFIVNYNMLKSPSQLRIEKNKQKKDFEDIQTSMKVIRNLCAPTNRPMTKLGRIFAPYIVDLNAFVSTGESTSAFYKDKEQQDLDQSKYVFNQILSSDPSAKQVFSKLQAGEDFLPPRVHLGDINADGFPDILVTI